MTRYAVDHTRNALTAYWSTGIGDVATTVADLPTAAFLPDILRLATCLTELSQASLIGLAILRNPQEQCTAKCRVCADRLRALVPVDKAPGPRGTSLRTPSVQRARLWDRGGPSPPRTPFGCEALISQVDPAAAAIATTS
ncbi:hypothetical protein [Nonomuraea sp. NPDC049480]|uniref:hypothetical protein n=1 Tax=Nonomuraea sp. NPDC049480 TaxID=3364353 RepID=UPI00379BAC9A